MRQHARAFTLVELLVVIAIIGILVAMLLPAVQAAREAARSSLCQHHLAQLVIAVNNYEMAHTAYPTGTVANGGPVQSIAQGYHHGWTTQLLPYIEQNVVFRHVDQSVGVYDAVNAKVRAHNVAFYRCPSSWLGGRGYSDYAAVQHDVEAPIDVANDGVFFLNSRVRYQDVTDGSSQTFFLGEKLTTAGDLGWMSGTRAILRNTGTRLNAAMAMTGGQPKLIKPLGPPGSEEAGTDADEASGPVEPSGDEINVVTFGHPIGPLAVGGFGSDHPAGANFAFGDGSIRFISETISMTVYQQLGNRHDGKLIDGEF